MGNQPSASQGPTMRAVERSGLVLNTAWPIPPAPAPSKSAMLRVRIHATAINPVDYKLPTIIGGKLTGLDFAGVVEEIYNASSKGNAGGAASLHQYAVGDKVYGTWRGALSDYVVVPVDRVAKMPAGFSFTDAAAMPTAYLTSLQGLRNNGFGRGKRLLVIGASGGCGLAACQLARAWGAAEVVAVCSGKNAEFVKENGATSVVDYTTTSIAAEYPETLPGDGYFDMVYDTASASGGGEDYFAEARAVLKPGGKHVFLNGSAGKWLRVLTGFEKKDTNLVMTKGNSKDLALLARLATAAAAVLLEEGDPGYVVAGGAGAKVGAPAAPFQPLVPVVQVILPFDEQGVATGFELLKSRRVKGKVVFDVAGTAAGGAASARPEAAAPPAVLTKSAI